MAIFRSVLFLILGCGVSALRIKHVAPLACQSASKKDMWGVWIDGQNATEGHNAYGKHYSNSMSLALHQTFGLLSRDSHGEGLKVAHFMKMANAAWGGRAHFRNYGNPPCSTRRLARRCRDRLPKDRVASIMANIKDGKSDYCQKITVDKFDKPLTEMFQVYNTKIAAAADEKESLTAVGWLMQNLAFLHPLSDRNGRSRLLLLQFELRRLNIACGTMMYSNNKEIYFEPLETYVKKLAEGINVYNEAQKHHFAGNPWKAKNKELVRRHTQKFDSVDPAHSQIQACLASEKWNKHGGQ